MTTVHSRTPEPWFVAQTHRLVLRLTGRAPDDALWTAREALFAGRVSQVARLVTYLLVEYRLPLVDEEVRAVRDLLEYLGTAALAPPMNVVAQVPPPAQVFSDDAADDGPDDDAIDAVGSSEDGVGLWACWARPGFGSPWPARIRCYVAEATSEEGALRLDRQLFKFLQTHHPRPRITVVGPAGPLNAATGAVIEQAPLVWTRASSSSVRIAPLFCGVDDEGQPIGDGTAPLERADREQLLTYLTTAEVVMRASDPADDVLDPTRWSCVPLHLRSDGEWVWSEASAYYLREHGLRPVEALVSHVLAVAGPPPQLNGVTYHRVIDALTRRAQENTPD
jgi:hypothetical protein